MNVIRRTWTEGGKEKTKTQTEAQGKTEAKEKTKKIIQKIR